MKILAGKEAEYADWKAKNQSDGYSRRVFSYAEEWADLMEKDLAAGKKLEDIAEARSREADTDGITGFMYGAAVSVLSQEWEHGELLRRWHNKDYGREDLNDTPGASVNPAIVTIELPS